MSVTSKYRSSGKATPSAESQSGIKSSFWLEAHDVVAAVDKDDFPGNSAAGVGCQKHSRRSDFRDLHIPAQRCTLLMALHHLAQPRDPSGGKRLDRPCRDRIHADLLLPKFIREITH